MYLGKAAGYGLLNGGRQTRGNKILSYDQYKDKKQLVVKDLCLEAGLDLSTDDLVKAVVELFMLVSAYQVT